jgi:hypothetical protein
MCVYVHVCVRVCMHASVCVRVCVCVCVCVRVRPQAYLRYASGRRPLLTQLLRKV